MGSKCHLAFHVEGAWDALFHRCSHMYGYMEYLILGMQSHKCGMVILEYLPISYLSSSGSIRVRHGLSFNRIARLLDSAIP